MVGHREVLCHDLILTICGVIMAKIDMFYDGSSRKKFDSTNRYTVKNQLRVAANIHKIQEEDEEADDDIEIETFEKIPVKRK